MQQLINATPNVTKCASNIPKLCQTTPKPIKQNQTKKNKLEELHEANQRCDKGQGIQIATNGQQTNFKKKTT